MKNNYEVKNINDFTYNIKINGDNKPMYKLLQKILRKSFYDYDTETIFFTAETVTKLHQYLLDITFNISHQKCIKMIYDLTQQIIYLKKLGYGFYGYDINDIIVINNDLFVFCSAEYLSPLTNDKMIFYSPIKRPYFGNPELFLLTTLPSEITDKCSYYSLAALIVYCLTKIYLLVGNEVKSEAEIEKILQPFQNTKVYWFLKRCLHLDSDKRRLLLI